MDLGRLVTGFSVLILWLATDSFGQVVQLPPLNIYTQWMTLSGFSSGGSFAQQLQISYSSLFSGIAVFSHAFYRCGPVTGVQEDYDNVCTTLGNRTDPFLYDTNQVLVDIQNYYDQDLIDNPVNIRNKRLYVFAGTRNSLFTTDMSLRILHVYEPLIQNTESIKTRVMEASLLLPTVNFGAPCPQDASENFFLGSCGISGAYEALQFLLGDVVKKPPTDRRVAVQPLIEFDQTEFLYGFVGRHDMDTVGYLYIPSNCHFIKCLFHFYFHGCNTGREFNGTSHIVNSGYMEVAELSNIVMVFPQVVSSPDNDIGCWDTYGFTGLQYATKRGHQVTVVRNMMARILSEDATSDELNSNQLRPMTNIPPMEGGFRPITSNSDYINNNSPLTSYLPPFDEGTHPFGGDRGRPGGGGRGYPPRRYRFAQDSFGGLFTVPSAPTSYYTYRA